MKIVRDYEGIECFGAWSGAIETQTRIIEAGKAAEFDEFVEEIFPDGCTETELNDFLWFDDEYIFEILEITDEEEDDEDSEDDEDDE